MAILIIILIICLMIYFNKKGKAYRAEKKRVKRKWSKEDADVLITTIIPTINDDDLNKKP